MGDLETKQDELAALQIQVEKAMVLDADIARLKKFRASDITAVTVISTTDGTVQLQSAIIIAAAKTEINTLIIEKETERSLVFVK